MLKKTVFFLYAILCSTLVSTHAQEPVKPWGEIARENLEMEQFPGDSSTSAVVLFDHGELWFNRELNFYLDRHVRIKILNRDGYDWADVSISYNEEEDQDVSNVEGRTYVLQDNGNVRQFELDRKNVFEEEANDDWVRTKFTLPGLEPGAVIEYRYRKKIGLPVLLPEWEFQKKIPVLWSEFNAQIPDWFVFNTLFLGSNSLHISESKIFSKMINFTAKSRSGDYNKRTNFRNLQLDMPGKEYRWVQRDIPALREEPLITTVEDHRAKIWFQLAEIRIPNQLFQSFLNTWDSLVEELLDNHSFGRQLSDKAVFEEVVDGIVRDDVDDLTRMKAVYDFVRSSIRWDGTHTVFPEKDIDQVLESKTGSSAGVNLLLTQMLRDAGLEADPLLLSTRDHGKLMTLYPFVSQFNQVIAHVKIDTTSYLLNATDSDRPYNLLAENDLNSEGLLVKEEGSKWIPIQNSVNTMQNLTSVYRIKPDGSIEGNINLKVEGYNGLEYRREINRNGTDAFLENLFGNSTGKYEIANREIAGLSDIGKPLEVKLDLMAHDVGQVNGEFLYLNPIVLWREVKNPFRQDERKMPIDYPYPFFKRMIFNIEIPRGYVVHEIPQSAVLKFPENACSFRRLISNDANRIAIVSNFRMNVTHYPVKYYPYLKNFYSKIIEIHNQPIVLKKQDLESGE